MKIELNQSITVPSGKFKVVWNAINNSRFFKSTNWDEFEHESNVYIWVDADYEESNNLPFGLNNIIKHRIIYIGRQSTFNPSALLTNRCVAHRGDSLSKYVSKHKNCVCHVIGAGMTVTQSNVLEANLIQSQWDNKETFILNKRQETKWVNEGEKYLKTYGSYYREVIYR